MKKHFLLNVMILCLFMAALSPGAYATETETTGETTVETTVETTEATTEATTEETRAPDQCGETLYWGYDGGTLTISGSGAMDDFAAGAPWDDYRGSITAVRLSEDVTYVGAYAFSNCDKLESVDLGSSLREVGTGAFQSCDALTGISMPASFKVFGEDSFRSCALLRKITFEGGMPSFRLNCLWDTYADLIYPHYNPWPLEHIIQLEEAFQGRIEFLGSDGSDPYDPEAEETTGATTEATTIPTTEAATQVTTAPTTAPTTEAATVETTVPTTEAVTTAVPETTQPIREKGNGGVVFAAVLCVLSLLAIAVLVLGKLRGRGGKYSR